MYLHDSGEQIPATSEEYIGVDDMETPPRTAAAHVVAISHAEERGAWSTEM